MSDRVRVFGPSPPTATIGDFNCDCGNAIFSITPVEPVIVVSETVTTKTKVEFTCTKCGTEYDIGGNKKTA